MRELQEMQAATAHCRRGNDTAQTRDERSEHDCCKKTAHSCCFKAPSRNGTPTTSVSVDAPRIAAVLPGAAPLVCARRFVQLTGYRPATPRTALAPPVLRL
jgi:hypothetical protein